MDWTLVLAGAVVGFLVGLTGVGGSALMTPILIVVFHVHPLAAISSDLMASVIMKPVGAAVHLRSGTVDFRLVRLLCYGSVPSAFLSAMMLGLLATPGSLQLVLRVCLGVALLVAVFGMVLRAVFERPPRKRSLLGKEFAGTEVSSSVIVAVGVVGGVVVGVTSVGSGSLIIAALMVLIPSLPTNRLVGTDLMQAIPLVGAAALGHLFFGHVEFGLTGMILIGAVPAIYVGARLSARAPSRVIRHGLAVVLVASAVKVLGVPTGVLLAAVIGSTLVAGISLLVGRQAAVRSPTLPQASSQPVETLQ